MEIPWWLNPKELGERTVEWLIEAPSGRDPNKSNGRVLFEDVVEDIQDGRPLARPYVNPLKEATRRGLVNGATHKGYDSLVDAEVAVRGIDLNSSEFDVAFEDQ